MPIRVLPPLLVNQIAAGEVVERPASVAKELIENALDSGATRIEVAIEQGGRESLRVTDDGGGIPFDELLLALAPHATSKIAEVGDLDAIATMGFRGEALASIASVSRLRLTSRPPGAESAGVVEAEGDAFSTPRPAPAPPGTTVLVRNLFFNVPARRRFLKGERAEAGRVAEVVRQAAYAAPEIAFRFIQDGTTKLDLRPESDPRARILAMLGRELDAELLDVAADFDGLRVAGVAGTPSIARPTARHLQLFLNGRPVVDRTVAHAAREAYRGLVEPGRWPTAVLFLTMDPALVDVNVHPQKAEVRFRDASIVHRAVRRAIQSALRGADLVPEIEISPAVRGAAEPGVGSAAGFGAARGPGAAPRPFGPGGGSDFARGPSSSPGTRAARGPAPAGGTGLVYDDLRRALAGTLDSPGAAAAPADAALPMMRAARPWLQVRSAFIVLEDEEGLLIVDQHALHERMMFERLKGRLEGGTLESQRLLVPAIVPADAARLEALEELAPLLVRLGIEAAPIGSAEVAVHAFSALLIERRVAPGAFLGELLDRAADAAFPPGEEEALHEVLDMMACKAAIKAGDRLSDTEIAELLAFRTQVERASNCPHGRPTTLRLTLRELERRFGRG